MESVCRLMKHMQEGCLCTTAVDGITNKLIVKAGKELELYVGRLDSELSLLQDFLSSLQYLVKHNNSCYSHLIEQGILQLMKVVFEQSLGRLSRDGPSESLQAVIELCTETSNVLADVNTKAKSKVVLELCPHFLDLLHSHLIGFTTRMEVLKSTNMLLEQCPTTVKENLLSSEDSMEKISGLVSLVKTVGDYEFQVGILECLMRLFPRKSRCHFAEKFFLDQDLLNGFMAIKDKDFETDCRLFLNAVNAQSDDPSEGVFSLPCVSAFVGNKQLRKPSDGGYEEFWVDFNIGSERLTLFCEQESLCSQGTQLDEDLWETVAIYKTDVQQCCFNEKDGMIELEICLKSPVCDIYPSQHQDITDNKIRVLFMPELEAHIAHAVGYTFNFSEKRSKASTVNTPLQISMKDVQNAHSQSKRNNAVQQNPVMPSPSQTGSQESVSRKHKVSVPSVPMKTPAASPMVVPGTKSDTESNKPCAKRTGHSKVSASINNIGNKKFDNNTDKMTSKETSKDFAVPKTPQGKTRLKAKVKTPVVTVTPPSRKTKKQISRSDEARDVNKNVASENVADEKEHPDTVIPDSLPFVEANQSKTDICSGVKASIVLCSILKANGLDDSGIAIDESRSTICSTSIGDAPDTSRENKMTGVEETECNRHSKEEDKTFKKVKKNKTNKTEVSKHPVNKVGLQNKGVDNLTKTEKVETVQKVLKQGSGRKSNKDETKKSAKSNKASKEDTNFGFDSLLMDEALDSVPDSLEIPLSNNVPDSFEMPLSNNIPVGQIDTCSEESNSKSKQSKKSKSNRKGKAKVEGKVDKEKISDIDSMSESEMKKISIVKSIKKTEVQKKKKKSFCDVDSSLKELNELNSKEDIENKLDPIEGNVASGHKTSKSHGNDENNETARNVYTFSDQNTAEVEPVCTKKNFFSLDKRKKLSAKKITAVVKGKGRKLDKIEKPDRPKQGETKTSVNDINDASEIDFQMVRSNCNIGNKRSLRSRSKNSKQVENSDDASSPSLSDKSDNKVSSDQSQSASVSPVPVEQTPENSPDKVLVNEHKIKSSLKKGRCGDSAKEAKFGKRKSRVSFDLPKSESQEKDSVTIQKIEATAPDNKMGNIIENEVKTIHSDTTDVVVKDETTDNEEIIISDLENHAGGKRITSAAKGKSKNLASKCSEILCEKENSLSKEFVATKLTTPVKVITSPVSSTCSSDSLYIESDDSYNARRYKMENGAWSKSKQRKKSALDKKSKNSSITYKSKANYSWKHDQKSDKFQDLSVKSDSPLVSNIDEVQWKNRKKSKKPTAESLEDGKGSKNVVSRVQVVQDKGTDGQLKQFERIPDELESSKTTRKAKLQKAEAKNDTFGACIEDIDGQEFDYSNEMPQRTESPVIDEEKKYPFKKEKEGKKPRKANEKLNINEEESHEETNDDVNGTHFDIVPFNDFQNYNDNEFKENIRKKKEKCSSIPKRNNLSYAMKSFEEMECGNSYSVSEQSFQTIADARGKNMVFQMSYLKSRSNINSKSATNKNKRSSWKQPAKAASYDPYDFEAHCENSSMASERIGRKDISKELNSKYKKADKKTSSQTKARSVKYVEEESSSLNSQESFTTEKDDKSKHRRNSFEKPNEKLMVDHDKENSNSKSRKYKNKSKKGYTDKDSLTADCLPENSSQEMMIDLDEEEENCYQEKPNKKTLIQDKKTKKWFRADADTYEEKENFRFEKKGDSSIKRQKESNFQKEKRASADFPTVDSFNKRSIDQPLPMDDDTMIIDSSVDENSISQFSKILKEMTACQGKLDTNFSWSIDEKLETDDTEIKTPCIIGSISSTPKVGSGKRKHYYPLNISVIKTPQSCKVEESDSDAEVESVEYKQSKKRTRRKKAVKYKELSGSDSEDERSECKSRVSTDSISFLDNSQNVSNKSEKSWILERRKTPKLKKSTHTYKVSKKLKKAPELSLYDNTQSEDSQEDEPRENGNNLKLQRVKEFLQHIEDSPLTIPSLSLNTPAVTPSIKSFRSFEEADDYVVTPASPSEDNRNKIMLGDDVEMEESQENYALALNVSCQNSDDSDEESSDCRSRSELGVKSLDRYIQQSHNSDEEKSVHKILQENMKLLLGDSGFASGPSSEVRPSRSTLKRKFPDIEEKSIAVSSSSSQVESEDEMEKSTFVPKKLFRFDPAGNTPQPPSLYSDVTEENDGDFVFQSGLSTVMAAFGADIQNHLKSKKQKIESFTKRTLKETQKHFHQTLVEQHQYQTNLTDDFGAKMLLEVAALEKDIQRLSDSEKKMEDFFKSQLDVLRSNEESQKKRLSNLKKLQSSFLDKTKKVNKYNLNIHKNMREKLKKDITDLQRKLVAETQRQEFKDVKTKLQKMF